MPVYRSGILSKTWSTVTPKEGRTGEWTSIKTRGALLKIFAPIQNYGFISFDIDFENIKGSNCASN